VTKNEILKKYRLLTICLLPVFKYVRIIVNNFDAYASRKRKRLTRLIDKTNKRNNALIVRNCARKKDKIRINQRNDVSKRTWTVNTPEKYGRIRERPTRRYNQ